MWEWVNNKNVYSTRLKIDKNNSNMLSCLELLISWKLPWKINDQDRQSCVVTKDKCENAF